jgi:D-3-phosphoglycerate dehydrogenase
MLLGLLNHIPRANQQVRNGLWVREPNRGRELAGRTVGIIGYGYTGRALARRLSGFGCRVLAYDKYLADYSDEYVTEAALEQIQAEATVLSFHVPLTPETAGYYDNAFMDQMRHPHWVLNLARGKVVSLDALEAGLSYGKVLGAALDVLDDEPPQDMPPRLYDTFTRLLDYDNVIFTPHIGGWSVESAEAINRQVLEALTQEFAPPVLKSK